MSEISQESPETPLLSNETTETTRRLWFTRVLRPIKDYGEWLYLLDKSQTLEEKLGLLHAGFNFQMSMYKRNEEEHWVADRFITYFRIADGWLDEELLKIPNERESRYTLNINAKYGDYTITNLRKMVAQKAMDMLLTHFFKAAFAVKTDGNRQDSDRIALWWNHLILSEEVLPTIQNFFRLENRFSQYREQRVLNYPVSWRDERNIKEEILHNFLVNLARLLWEWKESRDMTFQSEKEKDEIKQRDSFTRARVEAAKPWMIEVLDYIWEIGFLSTRLMDLNEPCLEKLHEIAMRTWLDKSHPRGHYVNEARAVQNIDEACFAGSNAAWLLKRRELEKKVSEKLLNILKAEEEKERVEKKLKQLKAKQ